MCCFSAPVRDVGDTRIFARLSGRGTQFLVYQMSYQSPRDVAMILPLPVASGTKAVRFLALKHYPQLFTHIEKAFPMLRRSSTRGGGFGPPGGEMPLPVVPVGSYVASFVPTVADFERLDGRFSISPQTWAKIPAYRDYGFAVFQLNASPAKTPLEVHPMAFEFRTRFDDRLFFPTFHIHDGTLHSREYFDHTLYYQTISDAPSAQSASTLIVQKLVDGGYLVSSERDLGRVVNVAKTQGIVRDTPAFKMRLQGTLPNQDTFIPVG